MSTSTTRSAPAATPPEGKLITDLLRRTRLFLSSIVFGAEAARPLDSRDVTAYLRTTDG